MHTPRPLVSVILATYNEAPNVGEMIRTLDSLLGERVEIIVVDDHSPDGTADVAEKAGARVIRRTKDRGLTNSVRQGMESAQGDILVWMDCDFSHPPEVVPQLVELVEKGGYDFAVASRFVPGGVSKRGLKGSQEHWFAVLLSTTFNTFIPYFLIQDFRDYTSGFIALRRPIFQEIGLEGDYGESFMYLVVTAIRRGYKFIEIPYRCMPRKQGDSKTGSTAWRFLKLGKKYIRMALWLKLDMRRHPQIAPRKPTVGTV